MTNKLLHPKTVPIFFRLGSWVDRRGASSWFPWNDDRAVPKEQDPEKWHRIFVNIGGDKAGKNARYKVYRYPRDGGKFYFRDMLKFSSQVPPKFDGWDDDGTFGLRHPPLFMLEISVNDSKGNVLHEGNLISEGAKVKPPLRPGQLMGFGGVAHSTNGDVMIMHGDDPHVILFDPTFVVIPHERWGSLTYRYSVEMDTKDTKNLGEIQVSFR